MSDTSKLAGKVSHHGAQEVKAPYAQDGKSTGGKVLRGEDLRGGRDSGK